MAYDQPLQHDDSWSRPTVHAGDVVTSLISRETKNQPASGCTIVSFRKREVLMKFLVKVSDCYHAHPNDREKIITLADRCLTFTDRLVGLMGLACVYVISKLQQVEVIDPHTLMSCSLVHTTQDLYDMEKEVLYLVDWDILCVTVGEFVGCVCEAIPHHCSDLRSIIVTSCERMIIMAQTHHQFASWWLATRRSVLAFSAIHACMYLCNIDEDDTFPAWEQVLIEFQVFIDTQITGTPDIIKRNAEMFVLCLELWDDVSIAEEQAKEISKDNDLY